MPRSVHRQQRTHTPAVYFDYLYGKNVERRAYPATLFVDLRAVAADAPQVQCEASLC